MFKLAMIVYGGSICLFLQYVMQAHFVFTRKGKIFWTILLGLVLSMIEATLVLFYFYTDINDTTQAVLGCFISVLWFTIIQIATVLSVVRLKSLGNYMYFDKYLDYIPPIVAFLELPKAVSIILGSLELLALPHEYYGFSTFLFSASAIVVEVGLYYMLHLKLNHIMELQPNKLKRLSFTIKFTTAIVLLLEFGIIVAKWIHMNINESINIDFSMRPLAQILRIYIIIQFYSDLLVFAQKQIDFRNSELGRPSNV